MLELLLLEGVVGFRNQIIHIEQFWRLENLRKLIRVDIISDVSSVDEQDATCRSKTNNRSSRVGRNVCQRSSAIGKC